MAGGEEINGPGGCLIGQVVIQGLVFRLVNYIAAAATMASASAKSIANVLVIAGDAAHQMPPFMGQGMNSGCRDAENLLWKINGVLKGLYSSKILETYETKRYSKCGHCGPRGSHGRARLAAVAATRCPGVVSAHLGSAPNGTRRLTARAKRGPRARQWPGRALCFEVFFRGGAQGLCHGWPP